MFGRSNDPQPVTPALTESTPPPTDAGKGRPTPKRKVSEAANKRPLVAPTTKKASRERAKAQRDIEYRAMQTGDERNMPAKDRGPVRRFIRDSVDARWNLGEFFLPVAAVFLVIQFALAKTGFAVFAILALYVYIIAAVDRRLAHVAGPEEAPRRQVRDRADPARRGHVRRPAGVPDPSVAHAQAAGQARAATRLTPP